MRREVVLVNINGQLCKRDEAKISVFDRGMLYGDSVYDVTLSFGDVIFMGDEHLGRLWKSASGLSINPYFSQEFLAEEIRRSLKVANVSSAYLRIIITRGEGELGLRPEENLRSTYIIIIQRHEPYPQSFYCDGVGLEYASVIRNDSRAINPNIKSGNYLNNLMALMSISGNHLHEAIMLTKDGFITECTTSNIWLVDQELKLMTPAESVGILSGITRSKIIEIAKQEEILLSESLLTPHDLEMSRECFISSTGRGIIPVSFVGNHSFKVEGKEFPGPITKKIMRSYQSYVDNHLRIKGYQGPLPLFSF